MIVASPLATDGMARCAVAMTESIAKRHSTAPVRPTAIATDAESCSALVVGAIVTAVGEAEGTFVGD